MRFAPDEPNALAASLYLLAKITEAFIKGSFALVIFFFLEMHLAAASEDFNIFDLENKSSTNELYFFLLAIEIGYCRQDRYLF